MAFFGLTFLGEQEYFRDSSEHGLDLTLFSKHDVEAAITKTAGKNHNHMGMSMIKKFLTTLYRGPIVPVWDEGLIREELLKRGHSEDVEEIPRELFFEACWAARGRCVHPSFHGEREYKPVEYTSMTSYKDATRRNVRLTHNPRDKFLNPVVSSHTIGWNVGETAFAKLDAKCTKRFPKTSSPESLFADAMAAANLQ